MCSIEDGHECSEGLLYRKDSFSVDDWISLKARAGIKVKSVCENHKKKLLVFYNTNQKKCCDPFIEKRHQGRPACSFLKPITVQMYLKSRAVLEFSSRLIPGQRLCRGCYSDANNLLQLVEGFDDPPSSASSSATNSASVSQDLFAEEDDQDNPGDDADNILDNILYGSQDKHEDAIQSSGSSYHPSPGTKQDAKKAAGIDFPPSPGQAAMDKGNEGLGAVGISPVLKRHLAEPNYLSSKLQKFGEEYEKLFVCAGATPSTSKASFEEIVVQALQDKVQRSTNSNEKICALSVALTGYSQNKVLELFKDFGASDYLVRKTHRLMEQQDGLFPTTAPKKGKNLPDSIAKLVTDFYEDDENSRLLPGKRDFLSCRVDGRKVHVQKRLVLCNLKELFSFFKSKHPEVDIGFSKFASLRPKHCVLAGASGTHSVCVCKYHQNVKLMIEGANFKDLGINILTYQDLIAAVICEHATPQCYLESCCSKCPGLDSFKEKLLDLLSDRFVEEITFKQWTTTDRSTLETKTMKTDEFVDTLISQLKDLLPHHHVAKAQSAYLTYVKENLKEGEVIVVSDFSENYSFIVQDSVQGFYWTNDQATVHPFVCYHKVNGKLETLSYIVVSDYMKHNISAVYAFQTKLVTFLREKVKNLRKLIFFSDGAAQQYKNCFNMINLTYHMKDFQLDVEWHFFATSHGKGPSDGLGGQFKRNATRESIQGTVIRTAQELYQWAAAKTESSVTVEFVTTTEVNHIRGFLKPRFYRVIVVNGIRDMHSVAPLSIGELQCKRTSNSDKRTFAPVEIIRKEPLWHDISEGDYITIKIKNSWKLAEVLLKDFQEDEHQEGDLVVDIFKKSGDKYVSSQSDGESISMDTVICKVQPMILPDLKYQLQEYDVLKTSWQLKVMQGKPFSQPEQIRKGTWE